MSGMFTNPGGDFINLFQCPIGVNRDMTPLSANCYLDVQWFRFDNGHPRTIGGYEKVISGTNDIVRGMATVSIDDFVRVFLFRNSGIFQVDFLSNGSITGEINVTPSEWIAPTEIQPDLVFSCDLMTITADEDDEVVSESILFVVGMMNSKDPTQTIEAPIFYRNVNQTSVFLPLNQSTAGGVIVDLPFLIKYGNYGVFYRSAAGNPLDWTENNYTASSNEKIIAAQTFQNGFISWTTSKLNKNIYDPSTETYTSVELVPKISLLSPSSIVSVENNTFYWVGQEEFYLYNGIVDIVINKKNRNTFFEKLNKNWKGKIWAIYMPAFKEIWFYSVEGDSRECNHVYIYRIKDNEWSDSVSNRSCGLVYPPLNYPLLADSAVTPYSGSENYPIWEHEKGFNVSYDGINYPIPSRIQTKIYSAIELAQSPIMQNLQIEVRKMEKDILHTGDIDVEILTFEYPNSEPIIYGGFKFTADTTQLPMQISASYISFRFSMNTLEGFAQFGRNTVQYIMGTVRS